MRYIIIHSNLSVVKHEDVLSLLLAGGQCSSAELFPYHYQEHDISLRKQSTYVVENMI